MSLDDSDEFEEIALPRNVQKTKLRAKLIAYIALYIAFCFCCFNCGRPAEASDYRQAPDGSYVPGSVVSQAPDGSWHGGNNIFTQTPDGKWHGEND